MTTNKDENGLLPDERVYIRKLHGSGGVMYRQFCAADCDGAIEYTRAQTQNVAGIDYKIVDALIDELLVVNPDTMTYDLDRGNIQWFVSQLFKLVFHHKQEPSGDVQEALDYITGAGHGDFPPEIEDTIKRVLKSALTAQQPVYHDTDYISPLRPKRLEYTMCGKIYAVQDNGERHMFMDVRGWGYLTGGGAKNLPREEAEAIQDKWANEVVNLWNNATQPAESVGDALKIFDDAYMGETTVEIVHGDEVTGKEKKNVYEFFSEEEKEIRSFLSDCKDIRLGDLVFLLGRFVHKTHDMAEMADLREKTMDYLQRKKLLPSPLRYDGDTKQPDVNAELLGACKKAADIFRDYERIHLSKTPPDRSKAERNGEYAYIMEQAIARAEQKEGV